MKSSYHFQLQSNNGFAVESVCPVIYYPASIDDLITLANRLTEPFYILGEGYNTLFIDKQAPLIVKPNLKGIIIDESENDYFIKVAASENWHELVCFCLDKGIYGLENMALIPGSVGAAPVQNIGAYGVELSDYCIEVCWFEFASQRIHKLNKAACQFGYRNSIFKQSYNHRGLITQITLKLPKKWQANLTYADLHQLPEEVSAEEVMAKVIALRQSKLPDVALLPNAGSFFKNPTVTADLYRKMFAIYHNLPSYQQANGDFKLAAGWLIEQTGLKGVEINGVGVHCQQALVLVNYRSNSGRDIEALAQHVQQQVLLKFGILLEPEVRTVYATGEATIPSL